ncbi:MAG: replication restart helicase PriA, partial [Rhodospirillaceae bacterium]
LRGVTGSGKTEVYLQAVRAALADGKRALVLLPEIALSEAILSRVTGQLGASVALWHSGMGQADRRRTWRAIARGKVSVVVGARSALFLPMADLGLIVVDEEHDAAFKQDEGVAYHGRDMAVVRGQLGGFPVLLASATPSLETLENVRSGRYDRVRLARRHGGAQLPEIALVDITETPPDRWALPGDAEGPARRMGWLTPPVIAAVEQCLAEGDQALLFLNRRGYAPLTLCRVCGYRIRCPSCTAWLVEHRRVGRLVCHHCGHTERLPQNCPSCGHEGSLAPCGPGVERLAEEAQVRFPEAQMVVAASDTMGGPKAAAEVADRIRAREVNLIIGTQVMAKGHHFAHLTMVGVVDGDLGLAGGDPRAAERTHQLLHQVAGRAGRAERPGRVLIQTADPGMPVMEALASGDSESFFAAEAEERQAFSLPPYGRLASILISGPKEDQVEETARRLGLSAPKDPRVTVLGPSPPPLAVRAGRHRRRILVASPKALRLQPLLRHWLGLVQPPSSVTVRVDVDPVSFL